MRFINTLLRMKAWMILTDVAAISYVPVIIGNGRKCFSNDLVRLL